MRGAGTVVAIAIASTSSAAQPPPEAPEPTVVESYRGSTLATDGIATALIAAGVMTGESSLGGIGAATFVMGAPLWHVSNGRYARAMGSAAMRVSFPLIGLLIGDSLPRDCGPTGDCFAMSTSPFIGLAVGAVAAVALDTIFLSKGDAPPPRQPRWAPTATPTRDGGLALGIVGAF